MTPEQRAAESALRQRHANLHQQQVGQWWDALVRGDGRDNAGNTYTDDDLLHVGYLLSRELFHRIDELTGALERARDLAVRAGAFDGESDAP